MVRFGGETGPSRRLIPIEPGNAPVVKSNGTADPFTFWTNYFRTKDPRKTEPDRLRETVRLLNLNGKSRDVHAALYGYLANHPNDAEPWMYEALALAIEMNQGLPADVKKALNYAADLAQRTHNPNDLVSVADKLLLKGYFERVGALLDEAAAKVPHRSEPLAMSIILAGKTKDPRRMAGSIERLLALGWPGQDDYFRAWSRNQSDLLAQALREEGRGSEADTLLAKVADAEARDVYIRLSWDGDADFDLGVKEPLGVTASYQIPRTVFGGSVVKNGYGSHPEEVYVCPRAFDGDYEVRINTIYTNPSKPVTGLTLETITHEGTDHEQKQVVHLAPDRLYKPVVVHLSGGRRKTVLPYINPAAELAKEQAQVQKVLKTRKAAPGRVAKPAATPPTKPGASSKNAGQPDSAPRGGRP
ncbi:MAG TPA: hypothetical protein VFF52_20265 [Isosphaeraceae bacterium]|nr:hypothetical protein [Isosphaeraceae bacterium]